jgi:hypothetical protein
LNFVEILLISTGLWFYPPFTIGHYSTHKL